MTLEEEGKIVRAAMGAAHNKWMSVMDETKEALIANARHTELATLFERLDSINTLEIKPAAAAYEDYLDRIIEAINQAQRAIRKLL